MTSGDLYIDLSKKMTKKFRSTRPELSNFFPRFHIPLVFELGGVVILAPHPNQGEGGWDHQPGAG